MLESGMVGLSDSVWHKGLPEWIPVYQFLEKRPPVPTCDPVNVVDSRISDVIVFRTQLKTLGLIIATFGIYALYLIASYSPQVSRITGRKRMDFGTIIVLEVVTLGIFGMIYQIILGHDLFIHSKERNTVGRDESMVWKMVTLNILSFVLSFGSAGAAFVGSLFWGAWSVWILQRELNLYVEFQGKR